MKQKITNILRIVILSAIFSTAIGYSLADWTPPTGSPPFNNTPPPINAGGATQFKSGNFVLGNMLYAKKAETQSTVAADSGTTLTTKNYVDGQIAAATGGTTISCWVQTEHVDWTEPYPGRGPLKDTVSCPAGKTLVFWAVNESFHQFADTGGQACGMKVSNVGGNLECDVWTVTEAQCWLRGVGLCI